MQENNIINLFLQNFKKINSLEELEKSLGNNIQLITYSCSFLFIGSLVSCLFFSRIFFALGVFDIFFVSLFIFWYYKKRNAWSLFFIEALALIYSIGFFEIYKKAYSYEAGIMAIFIICLYRFIYIHLRYKTLKNTQKIAEKTATFLDKGIYKR